MSTTFSLQIISSRLLQVVIGGEKNVISLVSLRVCLGSANFTEIKNLFSENTVDKGKS